MASPLNSSSEDELSHFKPSGLLYSEPVNPQTTTKPTSSNLMKYYECEDSCDPRRFPIHDTFKLFVFKDSVAVETIDLSKRSFYRLGRDDKLNQIPLLHQSISSQHAILQYRLRNNQCRLYLMDLDSSNGTRLNGGKSIKIEGKRFYEILDGDVINFGASTRDYVFMKNK